MQRRDFLKSTAYGMGAMWLKHCAFSQSASHAALPRKYGASDTVTLGSTGIKTSRLAMGTGTVGSGHHSHQTALGVQGLSALLLKATTITGFVSLMQPMPMAAILMWPRR
jgi:hypothetical protein